MKKITQFTVLVCAIALLSSCTTTYNQNRFIERVITSHKLTNDNVLKIGHIAPKPAWKCQEVNKASYTWTMQQFTGMFKLGGGVSKMQDEAIAYANTHSKVNYAYLYIPDQESVLGFNVTMLRKSYITYFQCKYPPLAHSNPLHIANNSSTPTDQQ